MSTRSMSRAIAISAVALGAVGLFAGTAAAADGDDTDKRPSAGERREKAADFAQCLRDNGIEVPHIDADDARPVREARWELRGELRAEALTDLDGLQAAREACADLAPAHPHRGSGPRVAHEQVQALMIECLRGEDISSSDATAVWEEAFDDCRVEVRAELAAKTS